MHERAEVWLAEPLQHRLKIRCLVFTETSNGRGTGGGGDKYWRISLTVKLVRIHHEFLFPGLCQIVVDRNGETLLSHVFAAQAHARVARAEPAECVWEPLSGKEFVTEYAMTYVVRVVKFSGRAVAVEEIDPDVMKQTSGSYQIGIEVEPVVDKKLLCHSAHDLGVCVDEIECLARRCVSFMQGTNLFVRRDLHDRDYSGWDCLFRAEIQAVARTGRVDQRAGPSGGSAALQVLLGVDAGTSTIMS